MSPIPAQFHSYTAVLDVAPAYLIICAFQPDSISVSPDLQIGQAAERVIVHVQFHAAHQHQ